MTMSQGLPPDLAPLSSCSSARTNCPAIRVLLDELGIFSDQFFLVFGEAQVINHPGHFNAIAQIVLRLNNQNAELSAGRDAKRCEAATE